MVQEVNKPLNSKVQEGENPVKKVYQEHNNFNIELEQIHFVRVVRETVRYYS